MDFNNNKDRNIQFPEVWGGIECSINRIQNIFQDQNEISGHYKRQHDIEMCAALGIKKLRYPILWENYHPEKNSKPDWNRAESELKKLEEHGVVPIAGLMHHGSGPAYTDLSDHAFPNHLAEYAKKVAERFPSLEYYTIINEPLTTARFSGLYGHWYPHKKDNLSFLTMLVNQLKGVVLAMQEIRKINPSAKLIQTEDLGKTYSSPQLKYQADFENERRWLTFDLLCGKITPGKRMWDHLLWSGIKEEDLYFFLIHPCTPDCLGLNHYITSERFLDIEYEKYPSHLHGGNLKHFYADVEAVRVNHNFNSGCEVLLQEAWKRYHIPIAITEAHMNCHREDQLRWFKEIWDIAVKLKNEKNISIEAVTAWSLFGAFGWNKLLTEINGEYEPGVYDLRSPNPRPTALSNLVSSLAKEKSYTHSLLHIEGWWKTEDRFFDKHITSKNPVYNTPPVLIIGKKGTLGNAFAKVCEQRRIPYKLIGREECDIALKENTFCLIDKYKPWAIINAAGYVRVEEAETEMEKCFSDNVSGAENLAAACKRHGIKFITFSSDLVFDGMKKEAYLESDKTNPLNVYGRSKAISEEKILALDTSALIIRTSAFFGPWDKYNFVHLVQETLKCNKLFPVASDIYVSPTYIPDLVNITLDLLVDDASNIWHIANNSAISWSDLAYEIAARGRLKTEMILPMQYAQMNLRARMPAQSILKSEKGNFLPDLDHALGRYFHEKRICETVPG
ncbi:MAG: sugar nucleotide-binding protein [Bacteroidota bacterium]|nr:sugar nucleotide-binding protein [Bacteroidota bacterium]